MVSHALIQRLTDWAIRNSPVDSVERLFNASPAEQRRFYALILRKQPDGELSRLYDEFGDAVLTLRPDLKERLRILSGAEDVAWCFKEAA